MSTTIPVWALEALTEAARAHADDLESGMEEGIYEDDDTNRMNLNRYREAIKSAEDAP